jgi:8-oxo-dGTP pyrophosphatase MutT (NUDIX family)
MNEPADMTAGAPAAKSLAPNDPPSRRLPTVRQVSAGGVVCRHSAGGIEVAIVRVGPKGRWQLPKGIVDEGEEPELTAIREVREEAGVDARIVAPLDVIEYWYVGNDRGNQRVRFHKFVHLFLLEYESGDVRDHDHEVEEARWVPLGEATAMLSFESERKAMDQAIAMLDGLA